MTGREPQLNPGAAEILDESLVRLHRFGPEWRGRLSNHAPMVVEAMVRHGHADDVESWVDAYVPQLVDPPRPSTRVENDAWLESLGDPQRLGDWTAFFDNEVKDAPWTDVLVRWWPRLLPGLAASATHSVIRLGHCVQTLRNDGPSQPRLDEFAQTLGYWAARWLPIAGDPPANGQLDLATALARLPALGGPDEAFPDRLEALGADPRWPGVSGTPAFSVDPGAVDGELKSLVTAATLHYRTHGGGEPVMLVHAATAPNAVLRVLGSLPRELWVPSVRYAWVAASAVTMIYNPTHAPHETITPHDLGDPAVVFDEAVEHGDEHVIKLADTAVDVYTWTADPRALDAVTAAARRIDPDDP